MKRILAVASGGGHWVQLLRCMPVFVQQDVAFVTVSPTYRSQVSGHRFYTVNDATRWNKFSLLMLVMRLLMIVLMRLSLKRFDHGHIVAYQSSGQQEKSRSVITQRFPAGLKILEFMDFSTSRCVAAQYCHLTY